MDEQGYIAQKFIWRLPDVKVKSRNVQVKVETIYQGQRGVENKLKTAELAAEARESNATCQGQSLLKLLLI